MFSHTGISGNSARFWKISAVGRLLGPIPRMSAPPMEMTPSLGSMKPEIILRIVVLPQPEGPRNEKNSPGLIATLALSTARNFPKSADTPANSTPALMVLYLL